MPDEQHADTLIGPGPALAAAADRTPESDSGPLAELDTARLRNMIARRVFGEPLDPIRIGRYPILRRIGQGGMGVVYAAYDNELDRRIALKLLRRGEVHDEAEATRMRTRMLREARALAQLSDPSIVQIYEVGEHDGQVFLAMEFVEGATLRRWCELEARGVAEVLELYLQAGRGLAAAHAAGLVHRDFKPDNAIVGADGRVRVLDFGLALTSRAPLEPELSRVTAANDDARLTVTGALVGTPAYMAPEQLEGRGADARSDQFSFAVALFEALYGRRPFVGDTVAEVLGATLAGKLDLPSGRRVPSRVIRALRRALQRDPAARFAAMPELLRELGTRTRAFGALAAAAVLAIGTAGWLGVRSGELADAADVANVRADEAELRLRAREEAIVVGEAKLALFDDPNAALAKLAELPDDAESWDGAAWPVVQRAIDAGAADRVLAVPESYDASFVLDEHTVILASPERHAAWDLDTGVVEPLGPAPGGPLAFSPDGTWLAVGEGDTLRIRHLATGAESRWDITGCEASVFPDDRPRLEVRCRDGHDYSLSWQTPTHADEALRFERGAPHVFVGSLEFMRGILRQPRNATERHRQALESSVDTMQLSFEGRTVELLTRRGLMQARVERTFDREIDPLVLWDLDADRGRTVELPATPVVARFSRDGDRLAVAVNDGGIWLVDVHEAEAPARAFAKLDTGAVRRLQLSPDGGQLCAIAKDGAVVFWDLALREELARLRGVAYPTDCAWHADGSFVVLGAMEYRHYPAPSVRRIGDEVLRIDGAGGRLAVLRRNGAIDVVGDGGLVRVGVQRDAADLALSPDGSMVATTGARLLEVRSKDGTVLTSVQTRNQTVSALGFARGGETLVWVDENAIQIQPMKGGARRSVPVPREGFWRALAADGDRLVAVFGARDGSELVELALDGEERSRAPLELEDVAGVVPLDAETLAVAHGGNRLTTVTRDGTVRARLRESGAVLLDALPLDGGRALATVDRDGAVDIWDLRTGVSYAAPIAAERASVVDGGRHRLDLDASLAPGEGGELFVADRTGALTRHRFDAPGPGPALARWVRARAAH